jgi:cell division protein FtsZ
MTINTILQPVIRTPIQVRPPVLKVIGLGGSGCNAVDRMIELGLGNAEFIACNTDAQALGKSQAPTKIQMGPKLTRGLGAGGQPATGEAAAEESYRELSRVLDGADMVFLAVGLGGGTGTGSAPIVARVARSLGAIVIAIVSLPFSFEVGKRQINAREGLAKLQQYTDTLITIPNDRVMNIASPDLPIEMAFRLADDVLRQGVQGVSELMSGSGLINVDFAHVRHMMLNGRGALLTIGIGEGEHKAMRAIENALNHPLLDSINIESATGILVDFSGGTDLTFHEVADALCFLQEKTSHRAEIIPGAILDEHMTDRAQVIMIITGVGAMRVDANIEHDLSAGTPVGKQPESPDGSDQPDFRKNEMETGIETELDIPAFLRRRAK